MGTVRSATTGWNGTLTDGSGVINFESSDMGNQDVSWASRTKEPAGKTSPEELIAGAHSACFSMALSNVLAKGGNPPTSINTRAEVSFDIASGGITGIHLTTRGTVPDMDVSDFIAAAENAKANCPVSVALSNIKITLDASLD